MEKLSLAFITRFKATRNGLFDGFQNDLHKIVLIGNSTNDPLDIQKGHVLPLLKRVVRCTTIFIYLFLHHKNNSVQQIVP